MADLDISPGDVARAAVEAAAARVQATLDDAGAIAEAEANLRAFANAQALGATQAVHRHPEPAGPRRITPVEWAARKRRAKIAKQSRRRQR